MAGYHPAVEEYLETILELEESGVPALRARIVERLGVSAPAVSETVARLEREGYLHLDDRRVMRLTDSGRGMATAVMRRHRLAERLLVDVLHVPWSQVHEEAGRLEHAISPLLEQHLVTLLGDPATCPHGNPIPGSAHAVDPAPIAPLAELAVGSRAVVRRIDEELEARYDDMRVLETAGMLPGRTVALVSIDNTHYRVTAETGEVLLPLRIAGKVYVAAPPDSATT